MYFSFSSSLCQIELEIWTKFFLTKRRQTEIKLLTHYCKKDLIKQIWKLD